MYYWAWVSVLPRLGGYRLRQEVLELDSGAQSHSIVKVPLADLNDWDSTHDAVGRLLSYARSDSHESAVDATRQEKV